MKLSIYCRTVISLPNGVDKWLKNNVTSKYMKKEKNNHS